MSGSGVLKEGFLLKDGGKIKTWKRRYFILREASDHLRFEYYKAPNTELVGTFGLQNRGAFRYLESFALSPVAGQPAIEIVTPSRTYHLVGESDELREWAWAIQRGIDYVQGKLASAQSKPATTPSRPSSNAVPTKKAGFLLCRSHGLIKTWNRRWVHLDNKILRIFTNEFHVDKDALASITIDSSTLVSKMSASESKEQKYMFSITTSEKVYYFAGLSEQDLALWYASLSASVSDTTPTTTLPVSNSFFYQTTNDSEDDAEEILANVDVRSDAKKPVPPKRTVLVSSNSANTMRMNTLEKMSFAAIHEACCPPQFAYLYKKHEDLISFD